MPSSHSSCHHRLLCISAVAFLLAGVAVATEEDLHSPTTPPKDQVIVYKLDGVFNRLLQCTGEFEFTHCLQLFMVQRIERMKHRFGNSGDIKSDFLDRLFLAEQDPSTADDFAIRPEHRNLTSSQLSAKLMQLSKAYYFQKTRRARLEIIPGYSLDVQFPADQASDLITFALVRHNGEAAAEAEVGAGQRQARRRKKYELDDEELLKTGLPMSMVPVVGIAAIFPFVYPWLKMGAIFSLIVNKVALALAWFHLVKNHGSIFDRASVVPPPLIGGGR